VAGFVIAGLTMWSTALDRNPVAIAAPPRIPFATVGDVVGSKFADPGMLFEEISFFKAGLYPCASTPVVAPAETNRGLKFCKFSPQMSETGFKFRGILA